tara:strand:- start:101 stop:568 length:468 start_codon:yes stop_codon:yes gene_type:complete
MSLVKENIYKAIDGAFESFKIGNPTLEIICDKETLGQWYDFVKWCYAQDGDNLSESNIKKYREENNPDFDFEISALMENAIGECDVYWCKFNIDHQEEAHELYKDNGCDCDDSEDYTCECVELNGLHFGLIDNAFKEILNSTNTSCFKKLSKILL